MATKQRSTTPVSYRNSGQPWTADEVRQLRQLARENTPTRVIGVKLGRTPRAIQSKASEAGISLKPVNRSPYGRVSQRSPSKMGQKRSGARRRAR